MTIVGRVQQITRYPVKSMLGEALERCELRTLGIPGDRGYALRNDEVGEMCGAKKFPVLMQCRARYRKEPDTGSGEALPAVDLALADGSRSASDDPSVNPALSALVGKPVSLWPRQPADNREHYRRRVQRDEPALRAVLGLEKGEPFPDFSILPPDLLANLRDFTSPVGTYFDAYPIHFLTTGWLQELGSHAPNSRFESPRFRPNFTIESVEGAPPERAWTGQRLRIGGAELDCVCPTVRCSMTIQKTEGLPKDPQVLRTLVRESGQYVGSYATVSGDGAVAVGDSVELI